MQPVPSNAVLVDYATRWLITLEYRNPALAGVLLKMLDRYPGSQLLLPHIIEIFMEDTAANPAIPPGTA
ncbi:MAG: hypothetical protein KDJ31_15530 [Candidatus Competibacteraceae bacterium]|nr:hypothetical protein [Candidatus Competibacteraceae bacterium]MCB1820391.1 hypothetical protein [Candidatus Competibacteraceae bacterium]